MYLTEGKVNQITALNRGLIAVAGLQHPVEFTTGAVRGRLPAVGDIVDLTIAQHPGQRDHFVAVAIERRDSQ